MLLGPQLGVLLTPMLGLLFCEECCLLLCALLCPLLRKRETLAPFCFPLLVSLVCGSRPMELLKPLRALDGLLSGADASLPLFQDAVHDLLHRHAAME